MNRLRIGLRVLTFFWLVGSGTAQTSTGVVTGVVRDERGGVVPGVTVSATGEGTQKQVATNSAGQYRLDLAPGTYRLQASLAGFRRAVTEPIMVRAASANDRNMTLRLGIMTYPDLYEIPAGGLAGALRAADAVVHLRITQVLGPRLLGPSESFLTTEHLAVALSVLKGGSTELTQRASFHFWQTYAGEWTEDGHRFVGANAPYRDGDEFVGLFERQRDGTLIDFIGDKFMFRVRGGRVAWVGEPVPGISDGMPVDRFVAVLRELIPRRREPGIDAAPNRQTPLR